MIRIPKLSDPGDMVMRNSLFRGTPTNTDRFNFGCGSSQLFNPPIPPAMTNVQVLMGVDRQGLADLIAKQQDRAEQEINELQADQIEQLQAPRNAMEEYFVAQLARLRQKEIEEANNAYLTEEDKRQLALSPLRARAGIDGRFMASAEQRAEEELEQQREDMEEAMKGPEDEPRPDLPGSAMEASVAGQSERRAGTADPGSMGIDEEESMNARQFNAIREDARRIATLPKREIATYVRDEIKPLLTRVNEARGVGMSTTNNQLQRLRTAYKTDRTGSRAMRILVELELTQGRAPRGGGRRRRGRN